jgi:dipeptidyl aminopeptidase/acylaminoacyl peptidase
MKFLLLALILAAVTAWPAVAADRRPMTLDDLFKFARVADPQVSPDGTQVVYQVGTVDLDANKSSTALWLAATDGASKPRQLTNPIGKSDTHPRWSPDGSAILFESTRGGTGQLYVLKLSGGEAQPITTISSGAGTGLWSPDGKHVAFVSAVRPEFSELPFAESDAKNAAAEKAIADNPVKAKTFTKLFYRHWDSYVDGKRQHLFVVDAGESGWSAPRDVTPGDRDANPTSSTFSVGDDYTFSPDSKFLVFTAVPKTGEAWSTNHDICRVGIDNKSTDWETLTANKAADNSPRFSPDGKKLAWRAQAKPGYEADKWDIVVAGCKPDGTLTGEPMNLTASKDVSANEFVWFGNDAVAFAADDDGATSLFSATLQGLVVSTKALGKLADGIIPRRAQVSGLSANDDGTVVVYMTSQLDSPALIAGVRYLGNGDPKTSHAISVRSAVNDKLLAELDLPKPESVRVKVQGGEMQMWLLKPPGFVEGKKYPVVYLIHGGPQGAWGDGWSYRWNPELWAAQGYVIALPNPRGSTGFGQKFVDEISGDWGGKCYRDLQAGLEVVEKLPYVDTDRIASAGASFGGYMQDWFAVNDIAKKFKCQISHCSVYNFESMWGTTEELWFDEQEHGGLPWEIPGKYREFSPHTRAGELVKHKVPMLIIQNDLDFRCPIGQGHELFSALQRQGVPSRFVNFPDEGHWVLKPKNSQYWHKEVFDWLKTYCPPGAK